MWTCSLFKIGRGRNQISGNLAASRDFTSIARLEIIHVSFCSFSSTLPRPFFPHRAFIVSLIPTPFFLCMSPDFSSQDITSFWYLGSPRFSLVSLETVPCVSSFSSLPRPQSFVLETNNGFYPFFDRCSDLRVRDPVIQKLVFFHHTPPIHPENTKPHTISPLLLRTFPHPLHPKNLRRSDTHSAYITAHVTDPCPPSILEP